MLYLRVILCDDQESDRKLLIDNINHYCQLNHLDVDITTYANGVDLLSKFKIDECDILFLDIFFNDNSNMNGIDIAKKIRYIDSKIIIIFTTVSENFALDAFSVSTFDYIVKPIDFEKLNNTLNRCFSLISQPFKYIEVYSKRLVYKILQKDILYVEVYNKYCLIHTTSDTIKTYMPLSEVEKVLDPKLFLRCHRSSIVNLQYIKNFTDSDFILNSGDIVPIAKDKKNILKQLYLDYLFDLARY